MYMGAVEYNPISSIHHLYSYCSFLVLSLFLHELGGDSVHVGGALLGQDFLVNGFGSVFLLILDEANEAGFFELLEAVSDNLACALSVVRGSHSVSLLATIVGSEGGQTDLSSDVELISYGSSSHVEPVAVIRSKILEASSLHISGPL
jgi:hypothetical protein